MLRFDRSFLAAAAALIPLAACSSDSIGDNDGTRSASDQGTLAAEGPTLSVGGGGGDAGTSATSGGKVADAIPCAISKILDANCATCHGEEPIGAPFGLTKLSDFQGPSFNDPSRTMAEVAYDRVTASSPARRMPPTSVDPLSSADLKTLSDWLKGGAKAGQACSIITAPANNDAGGPSIGVTRNDGSSTTTTTNGGNGPSISVGGGGGGGAHTKPIDYGDPDLKCYPLTAFASPAQHDQKYSVPNTPDYYVAFTLKAPWSGKQYIKSFRSIIDNKAVLHHWLLYRQLSGNQTESVATNTSGAHPDGELLYGWAPGADDLWLDKDLGMELDENAFFQLEMHYNNQGSAAAPDASGVEVCVTPHKPEHLAGMAWVGEDRINGTTATGHCTPQSTEPVHVLLATPHMHKKGIHMKVDWTHAGGATETVHDRDFDFNYQRAYFYDNFIMQPGDKLTTTCTYNAPSKFGKGTNDEMCYFFTIHWPAGALSTKDLFSSIHGPNTCIDM